MSVTVTHGGSTITTTEGESQESVLANLAALDASSKDAKQAPEPDSSTQVTEPEQVAEQSQSADSDAKPAPAIQQDREPDGTFKKGGKKDAQSRIAHVTWEREEARRLAAAEKEARERLERELADLRTPKPQAATPAAPKDGRPSEDEVGTTYATYADYVEALADWKFEQRFKAQQAQSQQTEAEKAEAARRTKHGERIVAWRQANPTQAAEFDELTKTPSPDLPPSMVSAILDSEQGPALLHYLAAHPEECLQLMADAKDLPPSAAPWVRRHLESKLATPAAPSGPAPVVSRSPVPAPIQPVGASPVVSEIDTSKLTGKAYLEAENARELARRKRQLGLA